MSVAQAYVMLAIVGAVVPLTVFLPWLGQHGLDLPLLLQQLFASRVSSFFGLDVIVSAVAVLLMIVMESRKEGGKRLWLAAAATLLVGVSCGLPLFMAMRESRLPGA